MMDSVQKVATGLWFWKHEVDPIQKKFDPLTDPNTAFTLVDKLKEQGWGCEFRTLDWSKSKEWSVMFTHNRHRAIETTDPSLTRAICRGFVEVMSNEC